LAASQLLILQLVGLVPRAGNTSCKEDPSGHAVGAGL
jgi:hypothetical protein